LDEALCPERFDEKALDEIKTAMGRSFWALYQQDPQPLEGDFFKRTWFKTINQDRVPRRFERILRFWDKAATADGGDYTAGVLMGFVEGMYYVLDVVRGQWSTYEREKKIKGTAEIDLEKWGNRTVWIEQEPGSGGKDSAQATIRNLAGFTARAERPTGKKEVRAEPFAAQAEAGNVCLLRAPWNYGYLDELCSFNHGANDDQVDASSGAFNKLARPVSRRATSHRGY
jgi:predicted phage terminase large subunit-like protein